jgi:iron complex outermembrane recepter protein
MIQQGRSRDVNRRQIIGRAAFAGLDINIPRFLPDQNNRTIYYRRCRRTNGSLGEQRRYWEPGRSIWAGEIRMIRRRMAMTIAAGCAIFISSAATGSPQTQPSTTQPSAAAPAKSDLTDLSLEDLMNVKVTSVSKQVQKISEAPAAITVIGPDDIHRSGLNSIPELLRLVPGMDVAQVNANRWAITSRGINGVFADDLLVLMDGRSLYTPVFGGVRWNAVDYPLDDIDRIEVIRGPGSTLWGSNAVNGVVNIETKPANETQGLSLDSRLGTDQSDESARYGGQIDDDTYYRVYEKAGYTDSDVTDTDDPAHDEWSSYQSGFRIDRYSTPQDTLTFQGDGYYQQLDDVSSVLPGLMYDTDHENGQNVLGRWTHTESDRASTSLQVYYDRQAAQDFPSPYQQDTYDLDFQNRMPLGERMELTWGLGARDSEILFSELYPDEYDPRHWSDYLYSGFVQDQITLVPNQVQFYAGTKLEYDKIVDFQVQPGARLLWTPDDQNSIWAAVSRSVRVPSIYQDTTLDLGGFISTHHDQPAAEQTISYELGYKVQPAKTFTADVTGFYNAYRDLINYNPLLTPTYIPYGVTYANDLEGDTYGGELSANWQALPEWRLAGSYSLLTTIIKPQGTYGPMVPQTIIDSVQGSTPRNQFQVHSYLDLMKNVQWNTSLYYVDALPTLVLPVQEAQTAPMHFRLDMNLSWQPRDNLTISAGVQNILQSRHSEYGNFNSLVASSEVQRAYYVQCSIKF